MLITYLEDYPDVYLDRVNNLIHMEDYYCKREKGESLRGNIDFLLKGNKCIMYITFPSKKWRAVRRLHTFNLGALDFDNRGRHTFLLYDTLKGTTFIFTKAF